MLPLTKLGSELTAGIRPQQIAGIEIVGCDRAGVEGREITSEVTNIGAAPMPERPSIWHCIEGQDFFHPTVAVRSDDEHDVMGKANDDIMMKFALLPVVHELISSETLTELLEKRTENERMGQRFHELLHEPKVKHRATPSHARPAPFF